MVVNRRLAVRQELVPNAFHAFPGTFGLSVALRGLQYITVSSTTATRLRETNKEAQGRKGAAYYWDKGHLHARAEDSGECVVELARATAESVEAIVESCARVKSEIRRRVLPHTPAKPITSRVILLRPESTSTRPSLPSLLHSAVQISRS